MIVIKNGAITLSKTNLNKKIRVATKWSTITEIISKLMVPITNMILARILAPEAFGVIATITMIISFTEMLTDSGFQKFLDQRDFKDKREKHRNANVAFWSNLVLSLSILLVIIIFNKSIAHMVGNPGLGYVLIVASLQIPLTSFSSIQMALYRRSFDFKTLFFVRVIGALIPFFVTIPLALLGFNYWSLIVGMIAMQTFNAIFLTIKSEWKPSLYYNFNILKEMVSFSAWSFLEALTIWLCVWIDTFIISYYLNEYYLGIYKTSTIMVNSLLALVTGAIIPVLFAALSRLQNNNIEFKKMYFKFQRLIALFILPMGVGVLLFSDLATMLILGSQWSEASNVIGAWAASRALLIVFGYTASEVYRSKGMPKYSFYAQLLHLIVLIPTCVIAIEFGFWPLVYARSIIVIQLVLVHLILLQRLFDITILKTIKNVLPNIIAVALMSGLALTMLKYMNSTISMFITILVCAIFYFLIILLFPKNRIELFGFIKEIKP